MKFYMVIDLRLKKEKNEKRFLMMLIALCVAERDPVEPRQKRLNKPLKSIKTGVLTFVSTPVFCIYRQILYGSFVNYFSASTLGVLPTMSLYDTKQYFSPSIGVPNCIYEYSALMSSLTTT